VQNRGGRTLQRTEVNCPIGGKAWWKERRSQKSDDQLQLLAPGQQTQSCSEQEAKGSVRKPGNQIKVGLNQLDTVHSTTMGLVQY